MVSKTSKYTFSGHESFPCKTFWLKKGYDFINSNCDFNSQEAVINLGVGKNMVTSIRYWLRSFCMAKMDQLTPIATYLFDKKNGKDPYIEDLGTLWILHFLLVSKREATLYNWLFTRFQRERKEFTRQNVIDFVHRCLVEDNKLGIFNENTIKKDVGVLLQNYVMPSKSVSFDEYNSLLIDLELIRTSDSKNYFFNLEGKRQIPWQIFLYAIIEQKQGERTVSFDDLQELGLIFCMSDMEVIEMCLQIEEQKSKLVRYSDTAGVRQLQFIEEIEIFDILNEYYG
ncbi:MAG: DUF4007 family protein [Paludibacteraceae bacterium]|nr:DUF4007 family protein [Paludibacteraceae bacterium]